MALQQFVQKSAENGPKAMAAASNTRNTPTPMFSRSASEAKPVFQNPEAENTAETNPVDDFMPRTAVTLNQQDREVLSSLAAVQIRYNRPAEAVPYLMMLRRTDPEDLQAARLLALALMKLGNWEQAELILEETGDSTVGDVAESGILSFYRGLVAFKQRKLTTARQWLQRFRSLVTGGAA